MVQEVADIVVRERGARVVKRRFEDIADSATNATRSLRLLQNGLFVLGGAGLLRGLVNMLDTLTNFENRLKLVTSSTRELNDVQQSLFDIANSTRNSFEATAEIYTRTALAVRQLGIDQEETLNFTESLNQAVILSGASAREANAAMIQLSQGLASNRLSGDELRSVLEQLPFVADVIAKSLGVTRGELRAMGRDGQITAEVILQAFRESREEIAERFADTIPTVGQSFVILRNSVLESLDSFDDFTGSTELAAQAIIALANNMDELLIIVGGAAAGFAAFKFAGYIQAAYTAVAATLALSSQVKAGEVVLLGSVQAENLKAASLLRTAQAESAATATKVAAIRQGIVQLQQNAALLASQKAEQAITIANGRARSVATGQYVGLAAAKANLNRTTRALLVTERALRASKVELATATAAQTAATNTLTAAQTRATAASAAARGRVARLTAAMPLLGRVVGGVTIAFRTLTAAIIANPLGALVTVLTAVAIGFGLVQSAMASTEAGQESLTQSVDEYLASLQDMQRSQADITRGFRDSIVGELEQTVSRINELNALIADPPESGGHTRRNAQNRRNDELETLIALREQLNAQLVDLTRVLGQQEEVEERVLSTAEVSAQTRIARTLELAEATRAGGDAVQALNQAYRQADALDAFRQRLERAGVEAAIAEPLVNQMAAALENLQQAGRDASIQDAAEQIRRMQLELSALQQGTQVLDEFNRTFSQLDAIRAYRSELTQAGVDTEIVERLTTQFTNALIELDQTTRGLAVDAAISDVTVEIERMNAEALAISQGTEAHEAFKRTVAETQQIETFRQRLEEAGVTGSRLEGIINALTGAIFRLNAAAGQARIDAALEGAANQVERIREETAALAGGPDAFRQFQNASTVNDSVARLTASLREAGVEESVITERVNEHRGAMEGLVAQREAYNAALAASRSGGGGGSGRAGESQTFATLAAGIARENELLMLNSRERERQTEIYRIQDQLKRSLTDAELAHINALLDQNELLQTQADILAELNDPLEEYERRLAAINGLYEGGQIGQQGYIDLLRSTRIEFLETQTTMAAGLERGFLKALEEGADYASQMEDIVSTAFDGMTDALADFVLTGKADFASLIQDINKKIIKLVISQAFQQLFGGFTGADGGGGFFSGLLQGIGSILGAQNGAQFTVGQGNGMPIPGVDNRLLAMRVQDGETVTVTPKGQQAAGGSTQNNNIVFNISTPDVQGFKNSQSQIYAKAQKAISRGGRNT